MVELYRAIWQVTGRQQIWLIVLSIFVASLAAAPLKLQQLIINSLVDDTEVRGLLWHCFALLGVIAASAALKFLLNLRMATVGERVIFLIRQRLYNNFVKSSESQEGEPPKRGTLLAMISAEAEMVGAFAGSAVATPILQIGTLVSVIGFIAISQPSLGLIACAVILPQALLVIFLQRRINIRVRERVVSLRDASDRISGVAQQGVDDQVSNDFEQAFRARRRIFLLKGSSKFLLSAISTFGLVSILFVGGALVLRGQSDVGTVVASVTGLARIEGPWRDFISFFRNASTVRVKYGLIVGALFPERRSAINP